MLYNVPSLFIMFQVLWCAEKHPYVYRGCHDKGTDLNKCNKARFTLTSHKLQSAFSSFPSATSKRNCYQCNTLLYSWDTNACQQWIQTSHDVSFKKVYTVQNTLAGRRTEMKDWWEGYKLELILSCITPTNIRTCYRRKYQA